MEFRGNILEIDRELSKLDKFVLNFTQKLEELDVEYVIVSGYVAVITGRSRGTEDIDVIVEEMSRKKIGEFLENLSGAGYWCINADSSGVYEMLDEGLSPRFAEEDKAVPNFEVSFPLDEFERSALENSLKVKINSNKINISPLELQIAYKLYLGAEKDWEDAFHLYQLFKDNLDGSKLVKYSKKLEVGSDLDELRET